MKLNPEINIHLNNRRKEFIESQPKWIELEKLILQAGGQIVCMQYEEDLIRLIKQGKVYSANKTKFMKGNVSRCHENTALLWASNKDKGVTIVTGYALSDDGIWRQHSWGLHDGRVVETTEKRIKYFGFELDEKKSKEFFNDNAF